MTGHPDEHLDDELDDRLQAAGSADVPRPDDLTVARIEQRLRVAHAGRRSRPNVLAPVLAGVAAALVVVALANVGSEARSIGTAGTGRDLEPPELTLPPRPDDIDVGRPLDDLAGEPDVVDRPADDGVPDRQDGSTTTAPAPAPDADPGDDRPGDRTTTTVTDTRPTTVDSRPPTSTTRPTDTKPTPARISLRVEARGKTAVLTWSEYAGADLTSWSVVRTTEPPEGSLAPAREEIVLRDGEPAVRRFVDEPDARGRVSYVVRGHRRDGEIVARSARVTLER